VRGRASGATGEACSGDDEACSGDGGEACSGAGAGERRVSGLRSRGDENLKKLLSAGSYSGKTMVQQRLLIKNRC
jgi:hypothetical protein